MYVVYIDIMEWVSWSTRWLEDRRYKEKLTGLCLFSLKMRRIRRESNGCFKLHTGDGQRRQSTLFWAVCSNRKRQNRYKSQGRRFCLGTRRNFPAFRRIKCWYRSLESLWNLHSWRHGKVTWASPWATFDELGSNFKVSLALSGLQWAPKTPSNLETLKEFAFTYLNCCFKDLNNIPVALYFEGKEQWKCRSLLLPKSKSLLLENIVGVMYIRLPERIVFSCYIWQKHQWSMFNSHTRRILQTL